ncbi:excalibur calcium-binding domain-containing protein [Metabacillus litoralis]|uniref:excalibur calcium-binding domain-containing protein n=1 Tax=Metabacillus litoralis TaxID=152268 RepID=UPI00203D2D99|nr:excalibur calcium-binding domain-containing protein [Metabacillus litoralis]MCM3651285.1 excalibur calcium-binding domain-containing protein [Metabacillus litoralis]
MSKRKESDSDLIKRLIKEIHPDIWLIESASIGTKLLTGEYGAFIKEGLVIYKLTSEKALIKTGEIAWPEKKHGEVDHFAIKSIFYIDELKFVTGNHGKDVQKFLEGEKNDTFTKIVRPFHQKILGFRSKKRWKQVTAIIGYLLILIFIVNWFNGGEDFSEKNKVTTTASNEAKKVENTEKMVEKAVEVKKLDPNKPLTLKNGDFIVGKDILPGKYIASTKDEIGGNFAVFRDGNQEPVFNDILGTKLEPPLMLNDVEIDLKDKDKITLKSFNDGVIFTPSSIVNKNSNNTSEQHIEKESQESEREVNQQPKQDTEPQTETVQQSEQEDVYYGSCADVRAAGADPIYAGDPGYSNKLDRDGDGIACDK